MSADNVTPIDGGHNATLDGEDGDSVLYFLSHTQLMRGSCFCGVEEVERGPRLLVEFARRICAGKSRPRWSAADCGAVAYFLSCLEPEDEGCFCSDVTQDGEDTNATCGFHIVLEHIAHSLSDDD